LQEKLLIFLLSGRCLVPVPFSRKPAEGARPQTCSFFFAAPISAFQVMGTIKAADFAST